MTITEQYDAACARGDHGIAMSLLYMIPDEELPPDEQERSRLARTAAAPIIERHRREAVPGHDPRH